MEEAFNRNLAAQRAADPDANAEGNIEAAVERQDAEARDLEGSSNRAPSPRSDNQRMDTAERERIAKREEREKAREEEDHKEEEAARQAEENRVTATNHVMNLKEMVATQRSKFLSNDHRV